MNAREDLTKGDYASIELTRTGQQNVVITGVYLNPADDITSQLRELTRIHNVIKSENKISLFVGDWNCHCSWLGSNRTDNRGKKLAKWTDDNDLFTYHDGSNTFERNVNDQQWTGVLDFIVTSSLDSFSFYEVGEILKCDKIIAPTLSDHRPIMFSVPLNSNRPNPIPQPRINWRAFDFDEYLLQLETLDWHFDSHTPDLIYNKIISNIQKAVELTKPKLSKTHSRTRWWRFGSNLDHLRKERNRANNRYKKYPGPVTRSQRNRASKKYRSEIVKAKTKYAKWLNDLINNDDPNDTYHAWKILSPNKNAIPHVKKPDGSLTQNDIDKANQINSSLLSIGISPRTHEYDNAFHDQVTTQNKLRSRRLKIRNKNRLKRKSEHYIDTNSGLIDLPGKWTIDDVEAAISKLKPAKAAGPDSVVPLLIKNGGRRLASALTYLFNTCMNQGIHPSALKTSNVVVLFKGKGDPQDCANYRPLALTSIIGKLMEFLVVDYVYAELENRKFFTIHQGGFRKNIGCVEALAYCSEKWYNTINQPRYRHCRKCNLVLCDVQKAFDRASRTFILHKLYNEARISGNAYLWFESFLSNRKQRAAVPKTDDYQPNHNILSSNSKIYSNWADSPNGVPQGSICSPLLFLILVNEIPSILENKCTLYADDLALWSENKNEIEQMLSLNRDLESLRQYSNKWRIDLHADKFQWVRFAHGPSDLPILNGTTLQPVIGNITLNEKDEGTLLGLTFSNRLSFAPHVRELLTTTRMKLYKFRSVCRQYNLNRSSIDTLYKSMILSKICYGSEIWSLGCPKPLLNELQNLSYNFASLCSGAYKGTHKESLLVECGWLPLEITFSWNIGKLLSKIISLDHTHRLKKLLATVALTNGFNSPRWRLFKEFSNFDDTYNDDLEKSIGSPAFKIILKKQFLDSLDSKWNDSQKGSILRELKPQWSKFHRSATCGGSRKFEKLRAQLRMGWNNLNRTRCRWNWGSNHCPHCANIREDRDHVLLHCPKYDSQRAKLNECFLELDIPLTVANLLGCNPALKPPTNVKIRTALDTFLQKSGRFNNLGIVKQN